MRYYSVEVILEMLTSALKNVTVKCSYAYVHLIHAKLNLRSPSECVVWLLIEEVYCTYTVILNDYNEAETLVYIFVGSVC